MLQPTERAQAAQRRCHTSTPLCLQLKRPSQNVQAGSLYHRASLADQGKSGGIGILCQTQIPTNPATQTPTPTSTATNTPKPTPTDTPTPTVSPTSTPRPWVGDCNGSGDGPLKELIT